MLPGTLNPSSVASSLGRKALHDMPVGVVSRPRPSRTSVSDGRSSCRWNRYCELVSWSSSTVHRSSVAFAAATNRWSITSLRPVIRHSR